MPSAQPVFSAAAARAEPRRQLDPCRPAALVHPEKAVRGRSRAPRSIPSYSRVRIRTKRGARPHLTALTPRHPAPPLQLQAAAGSTACRGAGNLGALERLGDVDADAAVLAAQVDQAPPGQQPEFEAHLDGATAAVSIALLLLLLGITFQRVLGLDKVIDGLIRGWQERRAYRRRNATIEARQRLERSFEDDQEGEDSIQ